MMRSRSRSVFAQSWSFHRKIFADSLKASYDDCIRIEHIPTMLKSPTKKLRPKAKLNAILMTLNKVFCPEEKLCLSSNILMVAIRKATKMAVHSHRKDCQNKSVPCPIIRLLPLEFMTGRGERVVRDSNGASALKLGLLFSLRWRISIFECDQDKQEVGSGGS